MEDKSLELTTASDSDLLAGEDMEADDKEDQSLLLCKVSLLYHTIIIIPILLAIT